MVRILGYTLVFPQHYLNRWTHLSVCFLPLLVFSSSCINSNFLDCVIWSIRKLCKIYHLNLRGKLLCLMFQSKHVLEFINFRWLHSSHLMIKWGNSKEAKLYLLLLHKKNISVTQWVEMKNDFCVFHFLCLFQYKCFQVKVIRREWNTTWLFACLGTAWHAGNWN